MKQVGEAGGKKIVYWQWERVTLDKLIEAADDEFPELYPRRFNELELFVSNGTLALVRRGTFVSSTEYYPVIHDFAELSL